jgi:hypothetical protein
VKGAPAVVLALCGPDADQQQLLHELEQLAAAGARVLAVAGGDANALEPIGLIALSAPGFLRVSTWPTRCVLGDTTTGYSHHRTTLRIY